MSRWKQFWKQGVCFWHDKNAENVVFLFLSFGIMTLDATKFNNDIIDVP